MEAEGLTPGDVMRDPVAIHKAINACDPFYRYDLAATEAPPAEDQPDEPDWSPSAGIGGTGCGSQSGSSRYHWSLSRSSRSECSSGWRCPLTMTICASRSRSSSTTARR